MSQDELSNVVTDKVQETVEEVSSEEEVPDYPEGFAGVQQAYSDIQNIFDNVAKEFPQWFFGSDDEEDGPGDKIAAAGGGDQTKGTSLGDLAKEKVGRNVVGGDGSALSGAGMLPEGGVSPRLAIKQTQVVLPKTLKPGARPKVSYQSQPSAEVAEQIRIEEPAQHQVTEGQRQAHSRIQSIVDTEIRHDDFAAEFIRTSGSDMSRSTLTVFQEKQLLKEHGGPEEANGPTVQEVAVTGQGPHFDDSNTKGSSLKLIYNPPIWPHQESLYKTLSRLPALRSLVLDDSKLKWLRELGSMLPNVKMLSVMRCGLKSLDGVMGLLNLENLFAADNAVTDPSPLAPCTNLRYLDLSDNKISELNGFTFLKGCRVLTCVKLTENPVAQRPNFHVEMRRLIPSLRELRPRILEVHGPGVYELYKVPEEEEPPLGRRISDFTGLSGWQDEERRLRNVYNPGRISYQKRAMTSIPYTVDEMDALLEELELSTSGEPSAADLPLLDNLWKESEVDIASNRAGVPVRVSTVPRPPGRAPPSAPLPKVPRAKTAVHFRQN